MRRAKAQPPQEIDPRLWEWDFRSWVQSEVVPIGEYLSALERKAFYAKISDDSLAMKALIRLSGPHLTELKQQIARRAHQAGGRFATPSVVVESSDGITFNVRIPFGPG